MEQILSRILSKRQNIISKREITGWITAFLLGRAIMFECIAPFGLAYAAAYACLNKDKTVKPVAVSVFALLGALAAHFNGDFIKFMITFTLFGFLYTLITLFKTDLGVFGTAFTAFISTLAGGAIYIFQSAHTSYDIIMLICEASVCFISIFIITGGLPVIYSGSSDKKLQSDTLISFYLTAAIAIMGFTDLSIGNINIGNTLSALYIMVIAMAGGAAAGAAGGIGVGIISSLAFFPITDIIGIYGACGLLAGLLQKYRKIGIIIGFLTADIIFYFYFSGFGGGTFTLTEIISATLLFLLTPKSIITEAESLIVNTNTKNATAQRAVDVLSDRLMNLSASFKHLGEMFSEFIMPKKNDHLADITVIFNKCSDKICRKCGLRYTCWEREFKSTYRSFLSLAPILYEKGSLDFSDARGNFSEKCIKTDEMVNELNEMYSKYKLDCLWRDKVQDGRELVAGQLMGVSNLLENESKGIKRQLVFDTHLENCIDLELEKNGIKCSDVTVVKNLTGRFDVTLKIRGCKEGSNCGKTISPIISSVLGVAMETVEEKCANTPPFGRCVIKLSEKERISVICSGVKRCKNGERECGDNFGYGELNGGKYAVILSDGMGSGKRAAKQSETVVELMNSFLDVGFEKTTAASMVNNALFLKPGDECSVTVDAVVFDLFASRGDFIKIGASASYIKRGNKVKTVFAGTMPMGILKEIDTKVFSAELKPDDIIVMVSDGLYTKDNKWLKDFIADCDEKSPKAFSEKIMEEAVRRKSNIIDDDMTVVTAKINER